MRRSEGILGGEWTVALRSAVACALLLLVPAQGWALCCALGHAGTAVPHGAGAHAAASDSGVSQSGTNRPEIGAYRGAPCATASASSLVMAERAPKLAPGGPPPATAIRTVWTDPPTWGAILGDWSRRSGGRIHLFSPLRI